MGLRLGFLGFRVPWVWRGLGLMGFRVSGLRGFGF